jgi:2-haloacid dehalogenase
LYLTDVVEVLHDAGYPMAVLSNGTPRMVNVAVRSAVLESWFAELISVDEVQTYKPSPLVYALGPQILGIATGELLFVSSNGWDVAGAKSFGYQVAWCNRTDAPEEALGVSPDLVVGSLDKLRSKTRPRRQAGEKGRLAEPSAVTTRRVPRLLLAGELLAQP